MKSTFIVGVPILALLLLTHNIEGAVYTVGDSSGWHSPSSSTYFSNWASAKTFAVGDILVFSFATGSHDVATVSSTGYNNCDTNTANAISLATTGPANITLTTTGTFYYICTFSNHCLSGQKLAITVSSSSSSTPSTPGSSASSPPPPPPKSASSHIPQIILALPLLLTVLHFILL